MPRFSYEVERSGERARIDLQGELDMAATLQLEPEVDHLLAEGMTGLTIDLGRLSFIDSTGITLLVSITERARDAGADLQLLRPTDRVGRTLAVTGVDELLPLV